MSERRNNLTGVVIPDAQRGTGRTTAIALKLLAAAIENPGRFILVEDHHGTPEANKMLLAKMENMAFDLGLKHLEFNKSSPTVVFKLWGPA